MVPTFERASDFVPADLNAASWESLQPLYKALVDRPLHCKNCLTRLINDRSELDAAAAEAGTMLYVNMTCHTDDEAINKAYLEHVQQVQPKLRQIGFELDKKISSSPFAAELDQARYGVLLRDMRAAVEIFRPENVPVETELTELDQEYSQMCGAMTVMYEGKERTLPQMGNYQEETRRETREQTWRLVAERRLADREKIDAIFEKMLSLRHRVARNTGMADYRDYAFKARRRFDYTPEDCHAFARGVEQHVVPALRRIHKARAEALGVPSLRPWDLAVDVKSRPPLKPFTGGDDLFERALRLFRRMDPALGDLFQSLRRGGCLDLESRKGKAPGGYQASRDRQRMPFIFMNATGVQRDVETMVHEAGHAFHALLCRAEPLLSYRADMPLEFCEVASMSMELTSGPFLDEFYSEADAARARRVHLEGLATILPWIATIDQFQHWMYTNPNHSRADRTRAWVNVYNRFCGAVDWSGLEHLREALWHRQMHLFGSPFYYIEYGIAQLGALQLYANYRRNAGTALEQYKTALGLGGSRPLADLFKAAGLEFDFSPSRIQNAWSAVEQDLAALPV